MNCFRTSTRDTVPDMEKRAVLHAALLPIPEYVHVHVKIEVQMVRCGLHPILGQSYQMQGHCFAP